MLNGTAMRIRHMTIFDIVYVPFPFTDLSSAKRRPCIIIGSYKPTSFNQHLIVAMITSKVSTIKFPHDIEIEDLKAAGLSTSSVIRLSKIVTIDSGIVIKKLGRLAKSEQTRLKREFAKLFEEVV